MDFFKIMTSFTYFFSPSRHPANNSSLGQQENLVSNAKEEGSHLITNQEEEKQEQNSATRTDVASFSLHRGLRYSILIFNIYNIFKLTSLCVIIEGTIVY
jgi:hypothetical protein